MSWEMDNNYYTSSTTTWSNASYTISSSANYYSYEPVKLSEKEQKRQAELRRIQADHGKIHKCVVV